MQNHAEPPVRKGGRPRTEHEEYIVWAHQSGDTAKQIAEATDAPIRTVYAVLERHGLNSPRRPTMPNPLQVLDTYEGATTVDPGRMVALATISAGYRNDKGYPVVSRDGTIHLHDPNGLAPGLAAKLKENPKRLTVALLHEPEHGGLTQRYTRYSATAVEAFGDESGITVIEGQGKDAKRRVVKPDDPDWDALRLTCKVEGRIFFALAEWHGSDARILFPDGFGVYCLRFTSRNSLRNFVAQANLIRRATQGRLVGIPLDVSITYPEVAGPDGKRQKVPVWSFVMRPPEALSIGSGAVAKALASGVREADALALPGSLPPDPDDYDDVITVVDLDEADERQIVEGAIDAASVRNKFFAIVSGTILAENEGRAAFIGGWCHENGIAVTESLSDLLTRLTASEGMKLLDDAERAATALRDAEGGARVEPQPTENREPIQPPEPRVEPEPQPEPQRDPGDETSLHNGPLTDTDQVRARAFLKRLGLHARADADACEAFLARCKEVKMPSLRVALRALNAGVRDIQELHEFIDRMQAAEEVPA